MNINPDDPRWTAYVLGELSETERARAEQELESSAAAREAVEEIRLATAWLKDELAGEAPVQLTTQQRGTVAAAASPNRFRPVFRWAAIAGSVAAGLLVVKHFPALVAAVAFSRACQSLLPKPSSRTEPAGCPSPVRRGSAWDSRSSGRTHEGTTTGATARARVASKRREASGTDGA